MKNNYRFLLIFITLIFISSCEEDLSPYAEFQERYVFNCVLRGDTSFQVATLSRNYFVENYDPYSYNEDPSVRGAYIRVWYGDSVRIFKDTSIARTDNTPYTTPYTYYYADGFNIPPETVVETEVILPNGKKLRSSTITPRQLQITYVLSDTLIPMPNRDFIRVRWAYTNSEAPGIYLVKMYVVYFKEENEVNTRYEKVIPAQYIDQLGEKKPLYPKLQQDPVYIVDMDVVTQAMTEIGIGETDKSKFVIYAAIFDVVSLDENLSRYYKATTQSSAGFSVKLDETDYSNIDGSYGVFGVYLKQQYAIKLKHDYIRSFGYVPGLTE